MYKYGADWTGTDISENQIIEAKQLAKEAGMEECVHAEEQVHLCLLRY